MTEVSNEELSNASKALHAVGIEVYNADGSFRQLNVILSELKDKWNDLSDAQQANIAFNIAATRQTSKFQNILESWNDSMALAEEATNSSGNAMANQEKYMDSYNGKMQQISTQMDAFWLKFWDSNTTKKILDWLIDLTKAFNNLADAITPIGALGVTAVSALAGITAIKQIKGGGRAKTI